MLMSYTKTNWNESTPITADKLNKIENGIASALPLTGGTLSGNVILNNDKAIGSKDASGAVKWLTWIDKANNAQFGDTGLKSVINSNTNPEVNVGGQGIYTLYHTGNKPTAAEVGALPLTGGTLSGNVVLENNLAIGGKDTFGTAKWLAWVDKSNNINLGDTGLKSVINSSVNPEVNISGKGLCTLYHTGNKPTLSEIGAAASSHTHNYLPLSGGTVSGETVFNNYLTVNAWPGYGTGTAQMWYDGNTKLLNIQNAAGLKAGNHLIARWEGSNPTHNMFRYGSGLGGANGYITFSY